MEFLKKAEEFCVLLEGLSQKREVTDKATFLEEYEVSVLGANTTTPFTNFIGGRDRLTVIMSRHVSEEKDSGINNSNNVEGMELLVDLDDSRKTKPLHDIVPISTETNVDIGRPLTRSRVYLNNSCLLHEGWSGAEAVTFKSARDGGLVPIPLDSARFIASLYCLSRRKAKEPLPDVWIACEPNNRKIAALGCLSESYNSPVRVIMVEEQGTGFEPDLKTRTDIIKTTTKSSSTTAFSEYDIMGNSADDDTEQIADDFRIQFAWNDPDGMLAPPSENSDAVLKMSTTPGGLFSPVLSTFQELKSLHTLCEIASGKMDFWSSGSEDSEEVDLAAGDKRAKEVGIFIEQMADPFNRPTDVTVISPSSDYVIFEPRTDLDFTEQLWMLCRNVTSFDELQGICARVFKAVLQGKIQPFVHRSSTSALSGLLRQVLLNPDGVSLEDTALKFQLLLSESKLLPCIVQIGIEKLKNDFRSFFLGADICSAEQFGKFFHSPPSSPASTPTLTPMEQCLELCRLHSVLELNAAVMKMIRLPSTIILSTFTKAAMEVFTKDAGFQPFAKTPVFSIPLPAYSPVLKSAVTLCSKLSPVVWCMTTLGKTSERSSVYLAGSRPLFNYHLQDTKNGDCYYLYKCSSS